MRKIQVSREAALQGLFCWIAALSFVVCLIEIFQDSFFYQWDLKVYYRGPMNWPLGADPYRIGRFVYPPLYLPLFKRFSDWFTLDQFYQVFLWAKTACFLGLLFLWKRAFLKNVPVGTFLLFAWLGFNATALLDFQAGNITVFETTLLFFALGAFQRGRTVLFAALVLVAASIKITPVFFLVLLLLETPRARTKPFFLACAAFLAFGLVNLIVFPGFTREFLYEAWIRTEEAGSICPSSLALAGDMLKYLGFLAHLGPLSAVSKVVYVAFAAYVLYVAGSAWRAHGKERLAQPGGRAFLVLFTILTYVLVVPRMKDYAYLIAVPSVLYAIQNFKIKIPPWILFLPLVVVSPKATWPSPLQEVLTEFWSYGPLLLVLLFWSFYLQELRETVPEPSLMVPNYSRLARLRRLDDFC